MEERVDSPHAKDDPPTPPPPPLPLPPGDPARSNTYLIQLPKDQVYRIPPPENALIVEQYRNPAKKKNSQRGRLTVFISILVLIILITIISVVVHVINKKPGNPTFSIQNFVAKNSTLHHRRHISFHLGFKAQNPKGATVSYLTGTVALKYRQKVFAKGVTDSFDLDAKKSKVLQLVLDASVVLPYNITKSLNEKPPPPPKKKKGKKKPKTITYHVHKDPLSLSLVAKIPIKMAKALKSWEMNMVVTCNIDVNTLGKDLHGKGTEIVDQDCQVKV